MSSSVKPKNSLLVKKNLADMVSLIVLDVKETFKSLSIDDLKNDINLIVYVMEQIEAQSKKLDSTTQSGLDKNDLCVQIFVSLFPSLSDTEKTMLTNVMEFVVSSNLIQSSESIIKKVANIIKKL